MSALESDSSRERVELAASWIARVQLEDGMIPILPNGHADPWNHVEAAMALTAAGEIPAAERAFDWLVSTQDSDGGFPASYTATGSVREAHRDTNAVAYFACGLFLFVLSTGSLEMVRRHFASLEAALQFVLNHQLVSGAIAWSIEQDGSSSGEALLAASSAIHLSLGAAIGLADALGASTEQYRTARAALGAVIRERPGEFLDKSVFAMDWYYPVLCGAVVGVAARGHLERGLRAFLEPGWGIRCRSDGRWVTAAESAECALAHWRVGEERRAAELLAGASALVEADGTVRTGVVHPDRREFPPGEATTYSAAAIVLANDALHGGPTAALFRC